ncbi:MAG: hypothetical protein U9R50_11580 [Campylobacterota bacterium]|nr:hypothetical protein [Campylobacterota bacterium]
MKINWNEFKAFKHEYDNPHGRDNFALLIEFLRSFYNVQDIHLLYDSLKNDDLALLMMKKRRISSVIILEKYMAKKF